MSKQSPWYLTEVKEKENKTWTDAEKIRVYTLRQDFQAKEIANIFKTTVNQVYNITRIVKNSLESRCYHCSNPLTEEEIKSSDGLVKACKKCKKEAMTYKRGLRNRALKLDLCGYCGKRKIVKGKKACKKCLSASYRRRQAVGLCGICGKNPVAHKGGSLCNKCLDTNRIKTIIFRQRKEKNESHAA
jgi:hypothetical protein